MTNNKAITNEDIMDTLQTMMQMTSDGFIRLEGRMDKLEGRMDGLEGRMDRLEHRMDGLEAKVGRIEIDLLQLKEIVARIEGEQIAQGNDIKEILDRLTILEEKVELSETERKEMREKLEKLIDWAFKVADHLDIPLDLPKTASI